MAGQAEGNLDAASQLADRIAEVAPSHHCNHRPNTTQRQFATED